MMEMTGCPYEDVGGGGGTVGKEVEAIFTIMDWGEEEETGVICPDAGGMALMDRGIGGGVAILWRFAD